MKRVSSGPKLSTHIRHLLETLYNCLRRSTCKQYNMFFCCHCNPVIVSLVPSCCFWFCPALVFPCVCHCLHLCLIEWFQFWLVLSCPPVSCLVLCILVPVLGPVFSCPCQCYCEYLVCPVSLLLIKTFFNARPGYLSCTWVLTPHSP